MGLKSKKQVINEAIDAIPVGSKVAVKDLMEELSSVRGYYIPFRTVTRFMQARKDLVYLGRFGRYGMYEKIEV